MTKTILLLTCVKDVASLTENGTSKTLASVLASSVFPAIWLLKGVTQADNDVYLNQSALYNRDFHVKHCDLENDTTHNTRTLLFSNVGAEYRSWKGNEPPCE
jgi:hypothetical protein